MVDSAIQFLNNWGLVWIITAFVIVAPFNGALKMNGRQARNRESVSKGPKYQRERVSNDRHASQSKEFNEKERSVDKVSKSSRFSAFAHLDIPGRICLHHRQIENPLSH